MGSVSTGAAIGAGFRLIGREPLAFLVWALVYVVIGVLPQLWVVSQMLPSIAEILDMARTGAEPSTDDIMAMQSRLFGLQPVLFLTGILSQAIIFGAIYRAILFPDERRFFYLRLGARELWMALTALVLVVLGVIALIVLMIPVAILAGVLGAAAPDAANWLVPILMLAVAAAFVWAALRMSMAPVMSFARSNFSLFESWNLTRGAALAMFLAALAIMVIGVVLAVLVGVVVLMITLGSLPGGMTSGAWMHDPLEIIHSIALPAIAAVAILGTLHRTFVFTLLGGAWAEMYRQLSAMETDA
jgi:hypothetical protein